MQSEIVKPVVWPQAAVFFGIAQALILNFYGTI
jgi:hypothetical protein